MRGNQKLHSLNRMKTNGDTLKCFLSHARISTAVLIINFVKVIRPRPEVVKRPSRYVLLGIMVRLTKLGTSKIESAEPTQKRE